MLFQGSEVMPPPDGVIPNRNESQQAPIPPLH